MIHSTLSKYLRYIVHGMVVLLFFAISLSAQSVGFGYSEKLLFRGVTGISMSAGQQEWKLADLGKLRQQSLPVSIAVPLGNRILFSVSNSPASAKHDTTTVQGLVDTKISMSYVVPGDKVWVNGSVSVPTGKTKLTPIEAQVTKLIAQSALGYRVPVFGQGLNANLGFAYAYSVSRRFVIGIGSSFLYKNKYTPIVIPGNSSAKFEYDPGEEISGNIGFDYTTQSKATRISFDATGTYYFPDKLNNVKIFLSGIRGMGFLVLSQKWGITTHAVQLRGRFRSQNTVYDTTSSSKYKSAQHYEAQYSLSFAVARWLSLTAYGESKNYTSDQFPLNGAIIETGTAKVNSGGIDCGIPISSLFYFSFGGRYNIGKITIDNIERSVSGIEFNGGLRVSF